MELQTAFYIIAIVFMGLMFIFVLALVVTVFVIKSKIDKMIDSKIGQAKSAAAKALIGFNTLKYFIRKP